MKRFFQKLKYVKITDILSIFVMIFAIPGSVLLRKKRKDIWLICEDKMEARDNGYYLYEYICKKHPEVDVVYAIDFKSADYLKVKNIGREVIPYGGYTHWKYYMAAKKNISSQKGGKPNAAVCYLLEVYGIWKNKRAFLQHGITKDKPDFLLYENSKINLFVCGAQKEYDYIKKTFGYPEGYVKYLGLARFDNLHNINVNNKQILVMPTWRNWIANPSVDSKKIESIDSFTNTNYYKCWIEFLNDMEIHTMLEKNDLEMIFYPHRNMQKFLEYFTTSSNRIKIADWRNYDVAQLLKESAYLITDYSSVFMDFAYMRKPMLYYQFDYDTFRKWQYDEGYFSYENDGFGNVCYNLSEVKKELSLAIENNFVCVEKYLTREMEFFNLYDQNNCERNFEAIKEM